VFFNGTDDYPDRKTLKLSEMFMEQGIVPPALELLVEVYNINKGHNADILRKSQTLTGYSIFVEKTREFQRETGDYAEAVKRTVSWCINAGILVDYLKRNGSEVENMLLTEWKLADARKVWEQEASERTAAKYQAQHEQDQARIAMLERQLAQQSGGGNYHVDH
jgi:hypothetical protein